MNELGFVVNSIAVNRTAKLAVENPNLMMEINQEMIEDAG
jgi:hypothetical protein